MLKVILCLCLSFSMSMPSFLFWLSWVSIFILLARAATPDEWRDRQIYQVLTDRFVRPDNDTTALCNVTLEEYCGGT
jgi:hypothetical protein